ncbi:MAG: tRNA preQ1(34) S-adenosylmethionine ribosyltransferase-isomerase QueA [Tenericutes bacterium HGW-Tenericutes-5]|jgi:S-adenosylmethionine:tRNA ribosyltransferase-isomerase|nr:MAG: tRNA preQ1(34) S-adenosylmethionine ribosyltransferase-isomerase QueA [Tenericutes bacterium HGW-Tenericutes-5]
MKTKDFDYNLPEELIAQKPLKERSDSRLLIASRTDFSLQHETFKNIINYIEKGSVLVLNNTKVIPARLHGVKQGTLANIEVLLLNQYGLNQWETLVKPAKRVKVGTELDFGEGLLKLVCTEVLDEGLRHFDLHYEGDLESILDQLGEMPLPPYIHEKLEDQSRYQTVYSKINGSAASPTAGLHFTKELLKQLENKGIIICYITLHVGLGTFRPVAVDDVKKHKMHSEFYMIDQSTADILNKAKHENRQIYAVGTTSVRTLETVYNKYNEFQESSGFTDIFIYPGYKFKAIDNLITNFHLPKSTLMMLVSAFASKEIIMNAYSEAIKEKYRFFSFGDSMLIKK